MGDELPVSFDALTEDALRSAGSLKWTRYGDALGAFVAEMDFGTAPVVTRALHAAVEHSARAEPGATAPTTTDAD